MISMPGSTALWRVSVRRMVVKLNRPDIRYEVESLTRMLLGEAPVTVVLPGEIPPRDDDHITVTVAEQPDGCLCRVATHFDGKTAEGTQSTTPDRTDCEQAVCRLIYDQLTMLLGHTLPWGMLTGVRPVKLVRQMAETGMTEAVIEQKLLDYGVSPERVRLSLETWQNQRDIISALSPEKISLYVSIPFCPSRCSYCSFVSHSIERAADMLEQYLPLLLRELRLTARLIKEAGLSVVSVYIGGGTPTTLSAPQMELLLQEICKDFDLSACGEFTVEAGRPDTITREKLMVLAKNGVNRISINPQTLNDTVLETIGRRHTTADFMAAWRLSEEFSFARNVDLIAGLPGDDYASFCRTLDEIIALHPENITVHTLTVKHASTLKEQGPQRRTAMEMVEYSRSTLEQAGYLPYYLYRQKGTVEALENVGYTLPGLACKYNVYIMDDGHTIISAGAGGVTKLVPQGPQRITRSFNYKYPYEYINRFQTMLERKAALPLGHLNDTEQTERS